MLVEKIMGTIRLKRNEQQKQLLSALICDIMQEILANVNV